MTPLRQEIKETHAQIETVAPLPSVRAHEATLMQVLANLLNNGLKFVEPGVQPKIRFWAEERGEKIRLWMQKMEPRPTPPDPNGPKSILISLNKIENSRPGHLVGSAQG